MKITLPIHDPIIKGYLHHAYPLSLFSQDDPRLIHWIASNYLQIYYKNTFNPDPKVNFYLPYNTITDLSFHPLVTTKSLTKHLLGNRYMDFIINSLDEGFGILTYVDEFYLDFSRHFENEHYIHDIFISGYDSTEKLLQISSFSSFIYKTLWISMQDFMNAFESKTHMDTYSFANDFRLLKINENMQYSYNPELSLDLLTDYTYARNTSKRFEMIQSSNDFLYGMDVYSVLIDILSKEIDLRAFHVFWEHKKIVSLSLQCSCHHVTSEIANLNQNYIEIEKEALAIRNMLLKYSLSPKDNSMSKIKRKLELLREKEFLLLQEIISLLAEFVPHSQKYVH